MKKSWMIRCVMIFLLAAGVLTGCGQSTDMVLDRSSFSQTPAFLDLEQDGTAMQLIAIQDPDGTVRLAFNTCQSCNGSPYAYFEYIGDDTLQCQNCGLTFPTATVGTTHASGCNPVSITDFSVDDDTVTIPGAVLKKGRPLFDNWKVFD